MCEVFGLRFFGEREECGLGVFSVRIKFNNKMGRFPNFRRIPLKKENSRRLHEESTMLVSLCSCDLQEEYLYENK